MFPQLFGALVDVQACEERLMNAWPSHQTLVVGDWLCRFARGYSGRANSACVVRPGATLNDVEIRHVEALYSEAGLRPSFRLSPLVGTAIRTDLDVRGYRPEDASVGMIAPAIAGTIPDALHLEAAPTAAWIEGACRWQTGAKRDTAALRGIVENIRVPTRYATLHHDGQPAAYALISLDRGMAEFGSVMVDPDRRGQGLGRVLVSGIIAWAKSAGAERIFLQAAIENEIARGLYASLGFVDLYTAAYWRKPD
ncbi:MAG: GCN5-like [Beijerinckiaceae bacterium]|nr:MAG: GCN5-like [Beijerinckiaceae bacterium]